jgi:CubicO group peptidase (beta-lactamase class C family)
MVIMFSSLVCRAAIHLLEYGDYKMPVRQHQWSAFLWAFIFVVLTSVSVAVSAQPASTATRVGKNNPFNRARAEIARVMKEEGLPSVAVAVAKDGKIIWEEGFGWADRERRIAATPHTPYALASISKPITATAIMKLAESGKIKLDAPIGDYIGRSRLTGLAGRPEEATVRRVLSHTAGLPLHYYFYVDGKPLPPIEETIARYGQIVYAPGKKYFYSNLGYRLLDQAIAVSSGQKYEDYLRSEIFVPLGMTRSGVGVEPGWASEAAARYTAKHQLMPNYRSDTPGGSDLWASAHDLARFGMFSIGSLFPGQQEIVSRAAREAMKTVVAPKDAVDPYGLGWFSDTERGFRRVSHTGAMPGVSTLLHLYPEQNLAIVVLTNQTHGPVNRIAEELAAAMLPAPYGKSLRAEQASSAAQANAASPAEGARPFANLRGKWTGTLTTYQSVQDFTLLFQPDGDVHVNIGTQYTGLLNDIRDFGGQLMARFAGTLPTEDARRHRHSLLLLLQPSDGELSGQLTAQTLGDPDIFALTGFVRLRPDPASQQGQVK